MTHSLMTTCLDMIEHWILPVTDDYYIYYNIKLYKTVKMFRFVVFEKIPSTVSKTNFYVDSNKAFHTF